jgi:hypothetical protein
LPTASIAVTVIVVTPNPTRVPAVGDCDKVMEAEAVQLSDTDTPANTFGTAAWQTAFAEADVEAGQVTEGGVASLTVTWNEH